MPPPGCRMKLGCNWTCLLALESLWRVDSRCAESTIPGQFLAVYKAHSVLKRREFNAAHTSSHSARALLAR